MGLTLDEVATELATWSHMARSGKVLTRKALDAMYARRANTGFPEPIGERSTTRKGGRPARVWDYNEVLVWYLEWVPKKVGRPPAGHERVMCDGCGRPMPGVFRPKESETGNHDS